MQARSTPIDERSLRGLHPQSIDDPDEIRALLDWVCRAGASLHRGLNAEVDLERACIERIEADRFLLRAENFEPIAGGQVFLNFQRGDRPYFFATRRVAPAVDGRLPLQLPTAIYYSERRDRLRRAPEPAAGDPSRIRLCRPGREAAEGRVMDLSPGGLGLLVPIRRIERAGLAAVAGEAIEVEFVDGRDAGRRDHLYMRHRAHEAGRRGWLRLGLCRAHGPAARPIPIEHRTQILVPESASAGAPSGVSAAGPVAEGARARDRAQRAHAPRTAARARARSAEPHVVQYANRRGEPIVGLLDAWGPARGATAVLLQNGWGQTKEALLPLARTLVASFRGNRQPIRVLRYDGIRRRGESHNDPPCRLPGREHLHFVFSQAVDDIEASVDYLFSRDELRPSSLVLVSVSASALEARRALARDRGRRITGWISLVGSPDLQSMTRSISGGVDYAAGWERGLRFGHQELLGVAVDTNRMGEDAEEERMIFIEDARRDMAAIRVPISWLHGQYDAWVDLGRVRDILSHGDTRNRRLITIPTGHQLKSSRQASEAFQLVASEVARMALGHALPPRPADTRDVRERRLAERRRLPALDIDLHEFWRDYLVGREGTLGIELLTSASAYRAMMDEQIRALELQAGDRIADLGCGVGAFALQLARWPERPADLRIVALDYVRPALDRSRVRLAACEQAGDLRVRYVEADLDLLHDPRTTPLAEGRFDALIASLLISYLERPERVLAEMRRLLRPGGRLVMSSLCQDADISQLWVDSVAEFQAGAAGSDLPEIEELDRNELGRNFLNDAARILDLEEAGAFHFWEPDELEQLVCDEGFTQVESRRCLGRPPQAVLITARRG